jgi:hemolysin activation/secretion protein
MVSRASNIEAVNRQLDIGSQGSELHAVIKARQWSGAASLINGARARSASRARAHANTAPQPASASASVSASASRILSLTPSPSCRGNYAMHLPCHAAQKTLRASSRCESPTNN